jgi:5-formyltetrahydrofolate cyclo-ligase
VNFDPNPGGVQPVELTKSVLRHRAREYRARLSLPEIHRLSIDMMARLIALPEILSARTLHVYWPDVGRGEPDLRSLIGVLRARKCRIALPIIQGTDGPSPTLYQGLFEGETRLVPGPYDLLEPVNREPIDPAELDVVIAPALIVGRNGHRVGHGAGYYDRFLADVNCPAVVAVYSACLVEHAPFEDHDIPVDVIVTENETLRP